MIRHYMEKLINKGTGAGGHKTTLNGKLFEHITSIETNLIDNNFIKIILNKKNKYGYYFEKNIDDKKIF